MSLPKNRYVQVAHVVATRDVQIRPFVPNDLTAIMTIVRESLNENYPTSVYLDLHRWWRDGFLVAIENGNPVGFLAGVVPSEAQARILMLAVTPAYRSRGIGSILMDQFLKLCGMRGLKRIELEVRVSNARAIKFYGRYGFSISQALPRFYTDGEDGYKMTLSL